MKVSGNFFPPLYAFALNIHAWLRCRGEAWSCFRWSIFIAAAPTPNAGWSRAKSPPPSPVAPRPPRGLREGGGGWLKQISPNEVSGPAATVQCVGRLWAANQHAATANGGISIGRLFHIQPGWSGGGSTLQPAFSNRWTYWCDARHQSWETENVYSPMWMDSTYSQAQNQKKTRIKKAHESAIIRHLCNKLRGFNKTAVPLSSNTLLYRLASLFNLDGRYLPKPPATPCQILPCFFLSFFPLSLFSFSFSFSFPHRVALS